MRETLLGIDIGGTKCAVSLGRCQQDRLTILETRKFATPVTPEQTLAQLIATAQALLHQQIPDAIGISCGGPLDRWRGIVSSPPNLPGWGDVDVVTPFREAFGVPVELQNDANAGALAEWLWGAGQGCQNVVFLTFGTGMGAGLILQGRLYEGTNGLAGEVGHLRLAPTGPRGYGKAGSFEGFCSGGGIALQAQQVARDILDAGGSWRYCPTYADLPSLTAEVLGRAAQEGDEVACALWKTIAERLGQGLAGLIDILNPERIIIGSIYVRQRPLLEASMLQIVRAEALAQAFAVCQIVPAQLGEQVGNAASLAVAAYVNE